MELPSINSTTSISDNPELKNYYDKLLFKNSSGKSLVDLPRKAAAAAAVAHSLERRIGDISLNASDMPNATSPKGRNQNFMNGFLEYSTAMSKKSMDQNRRASFAAFQAPDHTSISPLGVPPNSGKSNMDEQHANETPTQGSRRQSIFNTLSPPANSNSTLAPNNDVQSSLFTFHFDKSTTTTTTTSGADTNKPNDYYYAMTHQDGFQMRQHDSFSPPVANINMHSSAATGTTMNHQNPVTAERRSSYISDTLIHNQTPLNNNNQYTTVRTNMDYSNGYYPNNGNNQDPMLQYRNHSISGVPSNNINPYLYSPPTAPMGPYHGGGGGGNQFNNNIPNEQFIPQYGNQYPRHQQQQRRHSQLASTYGNGNIRNNNNNYHSYNNSENGQNRYFNGNANTYLDYHVKDSNGNVIPSKVEPTEDKVKLENGLLLVPENKLAAPSDLQNYYHDCGSHYFSSEAVYKFIDYIKEMISTTTHSKDSNKKRQNILKFLSFLKSCNLNYNPQSDAFESNLMKNQDGGNRSNNSTSSYLHYRPLVLVSLKNGKLELLSMPQSTNLSMERGDLVIIDGDRGKDLVLVVEPQVDLNLALFINFLKKKIHFDSLITSKNQHYPNELFVKSLVESNKGISDNLNPKLYDVIELTQLIVPSKQVLRFATPWEVNTNLHNKFQDELKALHIAQLKLRSLNSGLSNHNHTHNGNEPMSPPTSSGSNKRQLNIKILNAEFQFDRKKLTFYYICEERNDFRDLIKGLFKFYKTRIWLCAIPNNLDIDAKYYDTQHKELKMYQDMMQHYTSADVSDFNLQQQGEGLLIAPSLKTLELDDFQIGVYKELVDALFV